MHFGELLKRFREERKLTLRDLGKLSEVDHAYIHRLETGEKAAPSDDTVKSLTKALKLDSRQARIFKFLVNQSVPDILVYTVLEEHAHDFADFEAVVAMSHRGTRPKAKEDWRRLLNMVREMREEIERDG